MSTNIESKFILTKLDNTNYQTWKFKMKMLFFKEDLWEVVAGVKPEDVSVEWDKRDRSAMATIGLHVADDQHVHIHGCASAKEMWDALQKVHERANLTSKLYLYRKLYQMKFTQEKSMQQHITDMLDIVQQLRGRGEELKDCNIAALLLCTLPDSYMPLTTALEARPEEDLTLEYVKGKLMDEYNRRKEQTDECAETALKLQQNSYSKKRAPKRCFHCGKLGHMIRDCYKYKAQKPKHIQARSAIKDKQSTSENSNNCFKIGANTLNQCWYVDSGASSHMAKNKEHFVHLDTGTQETIHLADGTTIRSQGMGDCYVEHELPNGQLTRTIAKNVLYIPDIDTNLLSVSKLTAQGYEVVFTGENCFIKTKGKVVATAKLEDQLFRLCTGQRVNIAAERHHNNCIHHWHRRLGHRDPIAIKKMINDGLATGVSLSDCGQIQKCECCVECKSTRKPFPKIAEYRAKKPGELIHSDLCGPMRTVTPSGNRYVLTLIDDHSRYTTIYLLKRKSDAAIRIKEYIAHIHNRFHRKPEVFRSDGGGEYIGHDLKNYLQKKGIKSQYSAPYSPQQNGVAERKNRSLVEMARCMLADAGLSHTYWGEAVFCANYLQNRLYTRACELMPFEMWTGKKPSLKHTRIFGSKAFVLQTRDKRSKFDIKTIKGILVRYSDQAKAYRILLPLTNRVVISRNVEFIEKDSSMSEVETAVNQPTRTANFQNNDSSIPTIETEMLEQSTQSEHLPELIIDEATEKKTEGSETSVRRSTRSNKGIPAERLSYKAVAYSETEPESWSDLQNFDADSRKAWIQAAKEEMNALHDNRTWELVPLPEGHKPLGNKWIFKTKYSHKGDIEKLKARLVVKGYMQKEGIDYEETYAPVAGYTTFRALLTIAATRGLHVKHLDIKTAFLHGEINEDIYMSQPEGFVEKDKESYVCKLHKSIYGLKQSAHTWNKRIHEELESFGFSRSKADKYLYSKRVNDEYSYILLYVDDLLFCSANLELMDEVTSCLNSKFHVTDLGDATCYLGIQIEKEDGIFKIHQSRKIKQLLNKFGLQDASPVTSPMSTDYYSQEGEFDSLPDNTKYREAVGALIYLSMSTRPDISAPVSILSRRTSKPRERDWVAIKRIFKYLKSTINYKLSLGALDGTVLKGYVDADWGGDSQDRKSTSGFVFLFYGSSISWRSNKQTCVAQSSTEAVYVSGASACQELLWLKQLLEDLGICMDGQVLLLEDNQGCIKLAELSKQPRRTKHIDVKFHLIRDLNERGIIKLQYCPTNVMIADLFTKPLPKDRMCKLLNMLNVM